MVLPEDTSRFLGRCATPTNAEAHAERMHNSAALTMNRKKGHEPTDDHEDHHEHNKHHMSLLKKELMELEDKEEDFAGVKSDGLGLTEEQKKKFEEHAKHAHLFEDQIMGEQWRI